MKLNSITFPGLDEAYSVFVDPIAIPSGVDVNDYTTPGEYKSPSKEISASLKNTPFTGGGFKLDVIPLSNNNYLMQEIRCNSSKAKVYRRRVSRANNTSEWSYDEWYQPVQSTEDIVPISMSLLWTNASPSSSFAAQTISLDLSDYDLILIVYNIAGTIGKYTSAIYEKAVTNNVMSGYYHYADNTTVFQHFERKFYISDSSIKFEKAYLQGTEEQNFAAIPYKIYGIKGVS